jgi:hypothetical protein
VDLVDDLRSRGVRPLDEVARIAQGQRDHRRFGVESNLERFLVEQRYHVVDREGPAGELSHPGYVPLDALGRLEDRTDASKAAGIRDRRHQFWGCRRPDRCLHDRRLDA